MLNHFSLLAVEQSIERMTMGIRALSRLGPAGADALTPLRSAPTSIPISGAPAPGPDAHQSTWLFSSEECPLTGSGGSWWVLAVSTELEEAAERNRAERTDDAARKRAQARERLRTIVREAGLKLAEHCWVWDAKGGAQLVLGTYEDRTQAMVQAVRFSGLGLKVRVAKRV